MMIAAMNGRSEGGGFRIAPSARVDDGALDICWIDPVGPGGFLRYVRAVRRGTHERIPVFRSWRVDRLRVESEAAIRYHLDGEYRELPEGEPLEVEVDSGRVRLVG
ncbi:MAG: hypothetical protein GWN85_23795 [Gemmatimonadetes bacterium]|nr:hypothetical protein [Gemmatimonadota bacterium]